MLDLVDLKPGRSKPTAHYLILEAEADVRIPFAQLLALVCGKVDDQQRAAGCKNASGLGDRRGRRMRIVKHLVNDDAVGALVGEGERIHIALAKTGLDSRSFELHAGQPQHFR